MATVESESSSDGWETFERTFDRKQTTPIVELWHAEVWAAGYATAAPGTTVVVSDEGVTVTGRVHREVRANAGGTVGPREAVEAGRLLNWVDLPLVDNGRAAPGDCEIVTGQNRTIRVGARPWPGKEPSPNDRRSPIRLSLLWTRAAPGVARKGGPSIARLTEAEALQLADGIRAAVEDGRRQAVEDEYGRMAAKLGTLDGRDNMPEETVADKAPEEVTYGLTLHIQRLTAGAPVPVSVADVASMTSVDARTVASTLRAVADQLDPPKPTVTSHAYRRRSLAGPNVGDLVVSDDRGPLRAMDSLTHRETWRRPATAADELRTLRDLGVQVDFDGDEPVLSFDDVSHDQLNDAYGARDRFLVKRRGEEADRQNAAVRETDRMLGRRPVRDAATAGEIAERESHRGQPEPPLLAPDDAAVIERPRRRITNGDGTVTNVYLHAVNPGNVITVDGRTFTPFEILATFRDGVLLRVVANTRSRGGGYTWTPDTIDTLPEHLRTVTDPAQCDIETGAERRGRRSMMADAGAKAVVTSLDGLDSAGANVRVHLENTAREVAADVIRAVRGHHSGPPAVNSGLDPTRCGYTAGHGRQCRGKPFHDGPHPM